MKCRKRTSKWEYLVYVTGSSFLVETPTTMGGGCDTFVFCLLIFSLCNIYLIYMLYYVLQYKDTLSTAYSENSHWVVATRWIINSAFITTLLESFSPVSHQENVLNLLPGLTRFLEAYELLRVSPLCVCLRKGFPGNAGTLNVWLRDAFLWPGISLGIPSETHYDNVTLFILLNNTVR